jgi:DMSO/TMAO reductase YedYZ molybdopterin-dependent catalytic subunit
VRHTETNGTTKLGFKNPKHVIGLAVLNNYTGGYWEDKGYNWFSGLWWTIYDPGSPKTANGMVGGAPGPASTRSWQGATTRSTPCLRNSTQRSP